LSALTTAVMLACRSDAFMLPFSAIFEAYKYFKLTFLLKFLFELLDRFDGILYYDLFELIFLYEFFYEEFLELCLEEALSAVYFPSSDFLMALKEEPLFF
jgi:hypothetical protein